MSSWVKNLFSIPIILISFIASGAASANDCLFQQTATVVESIYQSNSNQIFQTNLISQNSFGSYISQARALLDLRTTESGELRVDYFTNSGAGIPVTIYSVELFINQHRVEYVDFTNNCSMSGISLFPGASVVLARWDLATTVDEACSSGCSLILRVFAH